MIALGILLGLAIGAVAYTWLGHGVLLALGAVCAILVLIGVLSDLRRYHEDRATAKSRMDAMRENDALVKILGRRRA